MRDAFLDRTVRDDEAIDIDVTTDARPDVVERIVRPWADAVWLQGQRFGTVGCRKDDVVIEITTFRAEVYRPESRKPEVVVLPTTSRPTSRGATSPSTRWRCGCPTRCWSTRSAARSTSRPRRLRTPLAPEISFLDDPLRMLRAARFVAQFDARRPIPRSSPRSWSCGTGWRS